MTNLSGTNLNNGAAVGPKGEGMDSPSTKVSGTNLNNGTAVGPQGEGKESPSRFPTYPAYKYSGVEWLGAVPTYWESWKISHAFGELGSGTTPPTTEAEWYDNGTVPWVTTGELRESVVLETKKLLAPTALSAFSALRLHPAGSLAIAMYGATIGRLGILGVDATTNQACCLLTRPNKLHVKFTFYWLLVFRKSIIDLYASGGGQPNINQEIIANLKVPAPGVPEQTQIARFLDHETARIDALIEEQQRLIELLKEKRRGIVLSALSDTSLPLVRIGHAVDVISRPVKQREDESYTPIGLFNRDRGLFHKEPREMQGGCRS